MVFLGMGDRNQLYECASRKVDTGMSMIDTSQLWCGTRLARVMAITPNYYSKQGGGVGRIQYLCSLELLTNILIECSCRGL